MRVRGWFDALSGVIERHRGLPFEYGVSDCFIFPMDVAAAQLGFDPWVDQRDYSSALGAAKRLHAQGFETVADAFAAKFAEVPVMMMGRGDLCSVVQGDEVCGAVCVGEFLLGKARDVGLTHLPRSAASRGFRIG